MTGIGDCFRPFGKDYDSHAPAVICESCATLRAQLTASQSALAVSLRAEREAREEEREAVVLWLWDRAAQYENSSGFVACLEDRAREIIEGTHEQALACGDLDDLRPRYRRARGKAGRNDG